MSQMKIGAARGLGFVLVVSFAAGVSVLLAQSLTSFNSGDLISAARINANFQIAAPENAVMAFHQTSCPPGWIAADGANGTPDLRGQFIRGLNDFGSAEGTRNDTRQDPDGAARTLGDDQDDEFAAHNHGGGSHTHNIWADSALGGASARFPGVNAAGFEGWVVTEGPNSPVVNLEGGNETRPNNVSLIFCMRKDT